MDNDRRPSRSLIGLPGAVIIAAALVAIAIIWTHKPSAGTSAVQRANDLSQSAAGMAPVTNADHILGNPTAPIKLIEFSDPSCPYCQAFNPVMTRIMADYGPGGNVAWVYRQFPLDKATTDGSILHPNSGREAEAFECAASLGGNKAFFAYEKRWFEMFPQDGASRSMAADNAEIAQTAKDIGLDKTTWDACIGIGKFKDKIDAQYADGINTGITGTPYVILITPSGTRIPLEGATSYSILKTAIDTLIANLPAQTGTSTGQ